MRNSGIVIERVTVEEMQKPEEPAGAAAEELENEAVEAEEEPCGEQCVEVEHAESVCLCSVDGFIFCASLGCGQQRSLTAPRVILSASLPVPGSSCCVLHVRFSCSVHVFVHGHARARSLALPPPP